MQHVDPSLLWLDGVSLQRGQQTVLHGIHWRVESGTAVALLGLNGAGKTTCLQAAAGILCPSEGRLLLLGQPADRPSARACMAYLPERVAPSPLLTGQEYAKIQLMGWRSAWEPEVFFGYCALLQLDRSKLDLPIRHYSKGMGQKLALATILSAKKRLLLLDEPMSGLDPLAREQAQQALQYFHQQGGTLVISSHSMEDIRVLCSHAVVLDQGRLAFEGSIEAIDRMGQGSLMVALRQLTTSHQKEELA